MTRTIFNAVLLITGLILSAGWGENYAQSQASHISLNTAYSKSSTNLFDNARIIVHKGWNMISIPLRASSGEKRILFPTATSDAFAYNRSYIKQDTLFPGVGYWLKFASAETITVWGQEICLDTFNLNARWNMISVPWRPMAISDIQTIPQNIVISDFYQYDPPKGYTTTDTLTPGRSYWVKASQTGRFITQCNPYQNDTGWTTPKQLSFDTINVSWSQILSNGSKIFVMWKRGDFPGEGAGYSISTDDGCSWTEPDTLTPIAPDNNTTSVNIASSSDWVYVVWNGTRPDMSGDVRYKRSSNFGMTWSLPQILGAGYGKKVVAIENKVFINFLDTLNKSSILYSSDFGASFTVLPTLPPIIAHYRFQGFVATPSGLYGTTSQPYGSCDRDEVLFYHSPDFGQTWDTVKVLSIPDCYNSNVFDLAYSGDSTIYVLWEDGTHGGYWFTGTVLMRKSTDAGRTFGPEKVLSPNVTVWHQAVAKDSLLYVVWDTDEDGTSRYSHIYFTMSRDYGETFDPPARIEESFFNTSYPDITISSYVNVSGSWRNTSTIPPPSLIFYTRSNLPINSNNKHYKGE